MLSCGSALCASIYLHRGEYVKKHTRHFCISILNETSRMYIIVWGEYGGTRRSILMYIIPILIHFDMFWYILLYTVTSMSL